MAMKKIWYEIEAPKFFRNQVIGETPASDPKLLVGRVVSMSLADLQQDTRRFYLKFNFRVTEVDGKAKTVFIGHDISYDRIYRMVQKHSRRVDCIQDVVLADGAKLCVKSILVMPGRASASAKSGVRKAMKAAVEKALSEASINGFMKMLVTGSLQSAIREECRKVYPVGPVEIRKSEVVSQPTKETDEKENIDDIKPGRPASGTRKRARKETEETEEKPKKKKASGKKKIPEDENKEECRDETNEESTEESTEEENVEESGEDAAEIEQESKVGE